MQRARELFLHAVGHLPPESWDSYVAEACGPDAELEQKVKHFLQVHREAGSFLEQPAPALIATLDELIQERPGTVIGPYRLLEQIGEGGFGVVFLAEQQEPLRRKVALKVLKPGMDSRQVVARFEAERQALALMDHPHIARVLDGGTTPSGRPYFVMELVRGVPITEFCDQNELTPRQRLELFLQVCQAVQHAHQKGIIHRDLKPSNVLVSRHDTTPVVKVIDFGVAKALGQELTDKTLFTGLAQLIGTPLYMSPEQAGLSDLDIDTRSDIYTLGVLLYELLTGTTPFARERFRQVGYDELRRIIREEEPPRPSTRISTLGPVAVTVSTNRKSDPKQLSRLLCGELDWIVMKALEKDRERRYETANGLARDVERYLNDEPVLACPPSVGYRLSKFLRRYKGPVLAGSVMLGLLVGGAAASTWQAVRATRAEQEKGNALERVTAEQASTKAALAAETAAKAQTQEALDTLTNDVVDKLLGGQPELSDEQKAFLRRVLGFYERFAAQLGETAEARLTRAKGQFEVARMRSLLGQYAEAEEGYRQAAALLEGLAKEFPDEPGYRARLAASHHNRGLMLAELGKAADAEQAFDQAVRIARKLVDEDPGNARYRRGLIRTYHNLGVLLTKMLRRPVDGETAFREALLHYERLLAVFPNVVEYQQDRAGTLRALGGALQEQKRFDEAEDLCQQALKIQESASARVQAVPWRRRQRGDSYHELGIVLSKRGKREEAEAAFQQCIDIRQRLADAFPAAVEYRRSLAGAYNDLGKLRQDRGKNDEALEAYRRSLELKNQLVTDYGGLPGDRRDLARTYANLGNLLGHQRQYPEAADAYRQAVLHLEKVVAESGGTANDRLDLASNRAQLGKALFLQGLPADAVAEYDAGLAGLAPLPQQPADSPTRRLLHDLHLGRARALGELNRAEEAREAWDRAVELAAPQERLRTRLERARWLAGAGKADEALAEVETLTRDKDVPAPQLCTAADVCARASAAATEAGQREAYAGRALALLRRAQAAGFFKDRANVERLKQIPDLAPLRSREDFRKFVREVEAGLKP
jgi:serine/threonine protein kinase/tetratricopeptide (TPR) repeat protein